MILIKLDLSLRKSSGNQGLCIEHVARVVILGVSDLTVGLWAKSGKLRPIGIGGLTILLPKSTTHYPAFGACVVTDGGNRGLRYSSRSSKLGLL